MTRRQIIWVAALLIGTLMIVGVLLMRAANHPHQHIYGRWSRSSVKLHGMPLNERSCLICGWQMYDLPSAEVTGR